MALQQRRCNGAYEACGGTGWSAVDVFSKRLQSFVPGWALTNGRRSLVVYVLDGRVHKKSLIAGSKRLRHRSFPIEPVMVPDSDEDDDFYPSCSAPDELELAMDLKMHLEIVAPFVKMAKKSTMCNCQLQGTAATRIMNRLCGEVQAFLQHHAKGMSAPARRMEENWCKILAVWNHFISEHLEFMVRCGLDGSIVVDFLETCLSHGMGKEAELEDLIEKVRAAFG